VDAPAPIVASGGTVAIAASYAPADPAGPPPARRDLANLMFSGTSAAPPPDDDAPDPGR